MEGEGKGADQCYNFSTFLKENGQEKAVAARSLEGGKVDIYHIK